MRPGSPPNLIPGTHRVQVITLTMTIFPDDPDALPGVWADLPLDPSHQRFGVADSFAEKFAERPPTLALARSLPIVVNLGTDRRTGIAVLNAIDAFSGGRVVAGLNMFNSSADARSIDVTLDGGDDGDRPTSAEYEGEARPDAKSKTGLKALEDIEDISIVAAPGSTFQRSGDTSYERHVAANLNLLISHAERMRYRIAVLDSSNGQTISDVRAQRAQDRLEVRRLLLPVGSHPRSDHRQGGRHAAERLRRRHLRPQRHQARGLQGAGQRGRELGASASSRR